MRDMLKLPYCQTVSALKLVRRHASLRSGLQVVVNLFHRNCGLEPNLRFQFSEYMTGKCGYVFPKENKELCVIARNCLLYLAMDQDESTDV